MLGLTHELPASEYGTYHGEVLFNVMVLRSVEGTAP